MHDLKTPAIRSCAGSPGRHRRRGLMARLHVARTVRVRARRILGAAAVIGGITVLCLVTAFGLPRSGASAIPGYQKPENPYLHSSPSEPGSGIGAAGSQPPRNPSLDVGHPPVPVGTPSAPSTGAVSGWPSPAPPPTSPSPSTTAS